LTEVSALEKRSSLFVSAIELFTRSQKVNREEKRRKRKRQEEQEPEERGEDLRETTLCLLSSLLLLFQYYFSGFPNRSEIFATLEEATAKKQQDGVAGTQGAEPHWVERARERETEREERRREKEGRRSERRPLFHRPYYLLLSVVDHPPLLSFFLITNFSFSLFSRFRISSPPLGE
jgi:hypothetical protein